MRWIFSWLLHLGPVRVSFAVWSINNQRNWRHGCTSWSLSAHRNISTTLMEEPDRPTTSWKPSEEPWRPVVLSSAFGLTPLVVAVLLTPVHHSPPIRVHSAEWCLLWVPSSGLCCLHKISSVRSIGPGTLYLWGSCYRSPYIPSCFWSWFPDASWVCHRYASPYLDTCR